MQGITNKNTCDNRPVAAPMANLKDLARISGFSISTVSKALNNSNEISSPTKKKLRKLALDHNYSPNKTACALRKQKTDIIMVCLPKHQLRKYSSLIEGVMEKSQDLGYQTILRQFDLEKPNDDLLQFEPQKTADGLIVLIEAMDPAMESVLEQHAMDGFALIKHTQALPHNRDLNKQRRVGKKLCKALIERINWKANVPEQFSKV